MKYSAEQTRKQSMIESLLNTLSGMILGFIISQLAHVFAPWIQRHIYSGFVWNLSIESNIIMTIILTLVSICRGYAWRRYFNNKLRDLNE